MLDHFIHVLETIISHKVFKEKPYTFKEGCILVDQISHLANLVGGGVTCSKFKNAKKLNKDFKQQFLGYVAD